MKEVRLLRLLALCPVFLLGGGLPAAGHGDVHAEIEALTARISESASEVELYVRRGSLFCLHGEWDLALADFRTAAERAPGDALNLALIGHALAGAGRHREAVTYLSNALNADPGQTSARLDRARCLRKLGDIQGMDADYRRLVADLSDPSPDLYAEWAGSLAEAPGFGREAALRVLRDAETRLGPLPSLSDQARKLSADAPREGEERP